MPIRAKGRQPFLELTKLCLHSWHLVRYIKKKQIILSDILQDDDPKAEIKETRKEPTSKAL